MPHEMQFSRRGFRELPGPSTRLRGSADLPYNPRRPLRLPRDRRPRKRPQLDPSGFLRLLLPLALLVGLGVGVFFGVDALLDDSGDDQTSATAAVPPSPDLESDSVAAPAADGADTEPAQDTSSLPPINADQPAASSDTAVDDAPADQAAADLTDAEPASAPAAAESTRPDIITSADLGGAPVIVERGAATPIPPGVAERTLDDGTPYDPTDTSVAFSSVWAPGTVLEITRLPGGPLLSAEEAALLIGKVIRVTVGATETIPTELQLSPAAFQLLALAVEPIIALRIEAVAAPAR
jgi:hypothetical protein